MSSGQIKREPYLNAKDYGSHFTAGDDAWIRVGRG